ncbi:thioredoxin family protein [Methanoculleus sp.]|jgi:thioredoxin 1|uniref:thioredoxin family protein n=1 Tax=Methanoculleus sp. TaxID=90427 RepID=UPI00260BF449|nr:thioredoxin family protein [Methanoculleus sp.]MDI6866360.1 thioredoxin family protein [Methanoculleus sp.]
MVIRVICFYQEGCMGCEEQTPILREVEKDLGIEIEEIDAVKNPEYIRTYNLRVTPTILVVADGGVKERMEGLVHREDLEAAIRRHMPEPAPD